jgi:hypothetical protein
MVVYRQPNGPDSFVVSMDSTTLEGDASEVPFWVNPQIEPEESDEGGRSAPSECHEGLDINACAAASGSRRALKGSPREPFLMSFRLKHEGQFWNQWRQS